MTHTDKLGVAFHLCLIDSWSTNYTDGELGLKVQALFRLSHQDGTGLLEITYILHHAFFLSWACHLIMPPNALNTCHHVHFLGNNHVMYLLSLLLMAEKHYRYHNVVGATIQPL